MTNRNLLLAIAVLGVAVTGLLVGQSSEDSDSDDSNQWEMFSQNVAGTGESGGSSDSSDVPIPSAASPGIVEGNVFIYNKQTGKVYRVFTGCGDLGTNGCIEAMPIVQEGQYTRVVPLPQSNGTSSQIRR